MSADIVRTVTGTVAEGDVGTGAGATTLDLLQANVATHHKTSTTRRMAILLPDYGFYARINRIRSTPIVYAAGTRPIASARRDRSGHLPPRSSPRIAREPGSERRRRNRSGPRRSRRAVICPGSRSFHHSRADPQSSYPPPDS